METGGIITGGLAQVGIVRTTDAIRSVTSCRASRMSVPGRKNSSIDDSCRHLPLTVEHEARFAELLRRCPDVPWILEAPLP